MNNIYKISTTERITKDFITETISEPYTTKPFTEHNI